MIQFRYSPDTVWKRGYIMKKRLVIVGLGLIGGSLAKALRGFED